MIQNIIHRLMEHADFRSEIIRDVRAMRGVFAEHVCKIVYYEPVDVSWYKSVYKSIIPAYTKLKSDSKKFLCLKDFKLNLWDTYFEHFSDFEIYMTYTFSNIEEDADLQYLHKKDLSLEEAYKKISAFGNALFKEYSKGRFLRERCTELCKEYLEK